MELKHVKFKEDQGIGWVQFDRPDKLNALNPDVWIDLGKVMDRCIEDDEVRVVIFVGHEKAFIAGADIAFMSQGGIKIALELSSLTMKVQEQIHNIEKPTIAAIEGYALGGGLELALCCDFRVATTTARLGLPEIGLGIIPGGGGTQRLPRLVGVGAAKKLVMLGNMIKSDEAYRIGLVDEVVESGTVREASEKMARKLIERPYWALRAAQTAINSGMNGSLGDGLILEQNLFAMLFETEDQREGMAAFMEKRKAEFKGK